MANALSASEGLGRRSTNEFGTGSKQKSRPVRGGKLFPRHEENCLVSAMRDLSQCVNLAGHALPAPPVPRHVKTPLPNAAPGSAGSILGGDVFAAILAIGDGLARVNERGVHILIPDKALPNHPPVAIHITLFTSDGLIANPLC